MIQSESICHYLFQTDELRQNYTYFFFLFHFGFKTTVVYCTVFFVCKCLWPTHRLLYDSRRELKKKSITSDLIITNECDSSFIFFSLLVLCFVYECDMLECHHRSITAPHFLHTITIRGMSTVAPKQPWHIPLCGEFQITRTFAIFAILFYLTSPSLCMRVCSFDIIVANATMYLHTHRRYITCHSLDKLNSYANCMIWGIRKKIVRTQQTFVVSFSFIAFAQPSELQRLLKPLSYDNSWKIICAKPIIE